MKKLKVGVFGDSYADEILDPIQSKFRKDESWISYIRSKGHRISSYGMGGSASYFSFHAFRDYYKQYNHIVFCWSFVHRMQTIPFKYSTLASIKNVEQFYANGTYKNYNAQEQTEIVQILLGYQHLCNYSFNNYVQQKMFDDVNIICKQNDIKLINILPFISRIEGELDFSTRAGDCLIRLAEVSKKELNVDTIPDCRSTHLPKENNEILGEIILERFAESKNILMDLYKQGNFIYSDDISNRYIEYSKIWANIAGVNKNL